MIKFLATADDEVIVGLGLSDENLTRLRQGQPIRVDMAEMGLVGKPLSKILIFHGCTDAQLQDIVQPMMSSETIVRDFRETQGEEDRGDGV